MLLGSQVDMEK